MPNPAASHEGPAASNDQGAIALFAARFAFTSATAASIAASLAAMPGWFAVCPFATLAG